VIETGLHRELHADAPLATQIVRFVARRHESVVLADATSDQRFTTDPHVVAHRPKSVLAMALLHRGQLSAVVYLENNMGTKVFNPARVERIGFIAAHAAAALENAKLYGEVRLANENLEQKVLQRTTELRERNRDMRLVLDNVNQGLLTVDAHGRLAGERSSVVNEWLRSYEGNPLFAALCSELDPAFARAFEVGFQALIEDVMPLELCLDQLPRRMKSRQRELGLTYSPILSGSRVDGLLIIINDLTEELRRAREEAEQQDQLAVFQHLVNDRRGLGMFFSEAKQLIAALQAAQIDLATRKRMLHTLKGNAGQLGLQLFARQCHELEEALFEQRDTLAAWTALQSRWHQLAQLMNAVLGERGEDVLEISQSAVREVAHRLRQGEPAAAIAAELDAWRTEPVARPLARLAEHGQALASRLGRSRLTMEIESSGLHVGLDEASPLWAALVHLVRNAIDHGIEPSSERQRQGKSAGGLLRFTATLRGSQFVLAVQDDGRGIAWHKVEQLAEQRGLAHESRADLIDALLADEFSTRSDATDTSGRGVGMAAVHRAVRALGGQLDVESEPGRGCCWRLTIPASAIRASRQHEAPSGSHQIDSRSVAV
jgi:two-component system chemotaxis sensor kinase CheA